MTTVEVRARRPGVGVLEDPTLNKGLVRELHQSPNEGRGGPV